MTFTVTVAARAKPERNIPGTHLVGKIVVGGESIVLDQCIYDRDVALAESP